ncbi:hypothetical protein K4L44_16270 [Halosquirtibacter laminarini]|uniref:Uncharacterized protein n=1 Tax=Halosquirtibacter laminarini TaxID=3374600 RepID=A0AC61NEW5_9BACT|nr:hypothetical protein K4L44_16270 [Prolixibacteraceae bacterium]
MKKLTILFLSLLTSYGLFAQGGSAPDALTYLQYEKYRFGGYGEFLYQHMDYHPDQNSTANGAKYANRGSVDVPRAVFSFEYKFTPSLEFVTEVEFEHLGTGAALEMEYEEAGEYEKEIEKGGEVALEQVHITKTFAPWFRVRAGHMIVPIGLTNQRHMPNQFFGTSRSESETSILPCTWHETGVAVLGAYRNWSYQLQVISGLDANGFNRKEWIKGGKQGMQEVSIMTSPAYVARVESRHFKNLILGTSYYQGNSVKNTLKPEYFSESDKGTVRIFTADFTLDNNKFIVRGNYVYGDLTDAQKITKVNSQLSSKSQYKRTPVASNAMAWNIEAGVNVLGFGKNRKEKLIPFVKYEQFDSMYKTDPGITKDERCNRKKMTFGLNYYMTPTLGLKMDYSHRSYGDDNIRNQNTFGLAVVYSGWFLSK